MTNFFVQINRLRNEEILRSVEKIFLCTYKNPTLLGEYEYAGKTPTWAEIDVCVFLRFLFVKDSNGFKTKRVTALFPQR